MKEIIAIDTHTHLNHGSKFDSHTDWQYYDATLEHLTAMNKACNIGKMFCSTFSSVLSTEEIEQENEYMASFAKEVDYLYQWVVVDPRIENTFRQAERMLESGKCVGIKLHPPCHGYTLEEYGDKIFSFAEKYSAIVQIHPEAGPDYILPFADKYPGVTFIMAHMGSFGNDHDVDALLLSKHKNVYLDTSGSASNQNKVIEYVVEKAGSTRILFGTDTYAAGFQRGRIEYALIPDKDKENILKNNAEKLFEKFLK